MVFTLALRNFIHDRVSLLVTLVGIVFSVVLMAIQLGLFQGTQKVITNLIDASRADLWITPIGAESIDDAPMLKGGEKYAALAAAGVAEAYDLAINIVQWEKEDGSAQAVVIVGADPNENSLKPWNVIAGDASQITRPGGVIVEKTYLKKLGVEKVGDLAQINGQKVTVVAITDRIRSFTTLPYVFTTLERGRSLIGARPDQSGFVMVRVKPGADIAQVQKNIKAGLRNADVLTNEQFADISIEHWLFATGAGAALIAGAVLGLIVGVVVVAQTLYASTKDHLNEFATLRALGASASYIHKVILFQALFSAVLGFGIGILLSHVVVWATWNTHLNILLTPRLSMILFGVTLAMCIFSALSAIIKVTRIDPAMVFTR
jgi:putative ABC transport system permease protein